MQTTKPPMPAQPTKPAAPAQPMPHPMDYYDTINALGDAMRQLRTKFQSYVRTPLMDQPNSVNDSKLTEIRLFINICQMFDPDKHPKITAPSCREVFNMSKSLSVEGHTIPYANKAAVEPPAHIKQLNAKMSACIVANIEDTTDLFIQLRDAIVKDLEFMNAKTLLHGADIRTRAQAIFPFLVDVPVGGTDMLQDYKFKTLLDIERYNADKALRAAQMQAEVVFSKVKRAQDLLDSLRLLYGHTSAIKSLSSYGRYELKKRKTAASGEEEPPDAKKAKPDDEPKP